MLICAGRLNEARAYIEKLDEALGGAKQPVGPLRKGFSPTLLIKVGLNDLARRRAAEIVAEMQRAYAQGNRSPEVYFELVMFTTLLGERDKALALLEEWRHEAHRNRSVTLRLLEFNEVAAVSYARLGRIDEAVALLREFRAAGFHLQSHYERFSLEPGAHLDARIVEILREEAAFASAQPDPEDDPTPPAAVAPSV